MGATAASERLRRPWITWGYGYDPFAMLPICGYKTMGDYFQHWFENGRLNYRTKLRKFST